MTPQEIETRMQEGDRACDAGDHQEAIRLFQKLGDDIKAKYGLNHPTMTKYAVDAFEQVARLVSGR